MREVKLNFCNFFTYFAFHPKDKRLSKEDQKTAKLATILFRFTIVGHAFCRLFLYKEITSVSSTTSSFSKHSLTKRSSRSSTVFLSNTSLLPSQTQASHLTTSTSSSSSSLLQPPSVPPSKAKEIARPSCKYILREEIKKPTVGQMPDSFITDIQLPQSHPCLERVKFFPKNSSPFQSFLLAEWPFVSANIYKYCVDKKEDIVEIDQAIDQRIEDWDNAIEFKKRVAALRDKSHLEHLTLGDLQESFPYSLLAIALANDAELNTLALKDIFAIQITMLRLRWDSITAAPVPSVLPKNLKKLTLSQFKGLDSQFIMDNFKKFSSETLFFLSKEQVRGLHPDFIMKYWNEIPEEALAFLSDSQIQQLNFSSLLHQNKFTAIFSANDQAKFDLLSFEQLLSCWHLLSDYHMPFIAPDMLRRIDFEKYPLTPDNFKALFPIFTDDVVTARQKSNIQHLTNRQIVRLWHHFESGHMPYLTDDHIKTFAYDRFDVGNKKDKEKFRMMFQSDGFSPNEGKRRIALIEPDSLRTCLPLISERLIGYVTNQQLREIDFDSLSRSKIEALFPDFSYIKDPETEIEQSRIKELKKEQILQYWDKFQPYHFGYLSKKQIAKLGESLPFDKIRFNAIFKNSIDDEKLAKERMANFPIMGLIRNWNLVDANTVKLLSETQLKGVGTDVKFSKDQFDALFPVLKSKKEVSRIQELTPLQVEKMLALFDETRIKYLSDDQIAHIRPAAFDELGDKGFALHKALFGN